MRTLRFSALPKVVSGATIVSKVEGDGPIGNCFDVVVSDDKMGCTSFEQAELQMFETAVRLSCDKAALTKEDLNCLLAGDLLNQIITANYGARNLGIPYLGLYGACSTMAESLLVGSALVDGGYLSPVACVACSHFSTAERQFRYPLEMGTTSAPTAQRTVTGAGCLIVSNTLPPTPVFSKICVSTATVGRVIDLGITDAANLGAAMAPAAADTLLTYFDETGDTPDDFDWIISGDLGHYGAELLYSLCDEHGLKLDKKHLDCGNIIYPPQEKYNCGGSGCGCSAVTLIGHFLPYLERGDVKRILFMATGALMSPTSSMQGESIPGIAHALVLEHKE